VKRLTTSIRPSRRANISLMGLLGTLFLHGLLALPFVLQLSLPTPRLPNRSGAGASAVASNREPVMTAIFINEGSPAVALLKPVELASRGVAPMDLPVIVFSPDNSPASLADPNSQDRSASAEAVGDQTQHALLYGRYLGQIQARIDRAWVRPRTDIGASRFACRARIEQGLHGDVVNVKLDRCNGSPRWQRSLISAIRTASPLPAPPDPSVYADVLSLVFESDGFRPGASSDGFEPANSSALAANQERESLGRSAEPAGAAFGSRAREGDAVRLTIVGDSKTYSTPSPPAEQPEKASPTE
jgi:hypothetical protein